jgi:hypothetical protein
MVQGYSHESISANISLLMTEGYGQDQAIAIALDTARKAWRRAHPKGPYPEHLRGARKPSRHRTKKKRPSPERYLVRVLNTLVYGYGYSGPESAAAVHTNQAMLGEYYRMGRSATAAARRIARG